MMTRGKKFKYNAFVGIVKQIVTIIVGLIVPRYILLYFGSDVNGLISSITQFLGLISLLEMGIGPVIQSNLYKPLADNDYLQVSKIMKSANKFFCKIGLIFLIYICVLLMVFPRFLNNRYDYWYTASLILIISLSTIAEYFLGITYQLLLNADQLAFVQMGIQVIAMVLNMIVTVAFITKGYSVHIVKLFTTIIYCVRPFLLRIYVRRRYPIDYSSTYTEEPIKQKWNGFTQHLAAVINGRTDVLLLTIFRDIKEVSVYSVYYMVVSGIEQLVMSLVTGLEAMWGNMLANKEDEKLRESFSNTEMLIHYLVTILFTITALMITPFAKVYTSGVSDVNYDQPLFGALLAFGYGAECLRIPYFRLIKAAGHYKQTQLASIIQAGLNLGISLVLVNRFGLIGVAIGTFVAMSYHTIYLAFYIRKNIICRKIIYFFKHVFVDAISVVLVYVVLTHTNYVIIDYMSWIIVAIIYSVATIIIISIVYTLFYRSEFVNILKKMRNH